MKSISELKDALEKYNALNAIYESIEIGNREAIVWGRKLNELTTEFCGTQYWDMLMNKIDHVKSFRTA